MKKLHILLLLFLFAGMQSLAAQNEGRDEVFTLKVTPSATAEGRLSFEGAEQRTGNTVSTPNDAEGRIRVSGDYKSMLGGVVEAEGNLNLSAGTVQVGFGDNAYAYVYPLQIFNLGFDKEVFDLYLQGGRFELDFQNAKYAGDDDWVKDVDPLGRDYRINMQLDLKILNMITVRYGQSFEPFDDKDFGNDLGFGILFEKAFGAHKLMASVGYVVDATNNIASYDSNPGNDVNYTAKDYDQVAISVAYQGIFGQIVLMPFLNFRYAGLINKPKRAAYESGRASWSAGLKFQYKDPDNQFDMIGVGLDIDGTLDRQNYNYYDISMKLRDARKNSNQNKLFTGFQLKVWSDILRSIMGKNYLSAWAKVRMETWVPNNGSITDLIVDSDIKRESIFKELGFGVKQYFVNQTNASLALYAEFTLENIAPFSVDRSGYFGSDLTEAKNGDLSMYLDFGLDASFTGVYRR